MAVMGLISRIRGRLGHSGTKADKPSVFGVPIKTADWVPDGDALFIYNGVDNIVRNDATNKEARYEVKKPRMVILHTGVTPDLAKWRLSQRLRQAKNQAKGSQNATRKEWQNHGE